MSGPGRTHAARAFVTPGRRDAEPYCFYSIGLYRQALLTRGRPEPGSASISDRAHYGLAESVLRRCHQLAAGPAWHVRRPEPPIRANGVAGIYPRDTAAFWRAVMRRQAAGLPRTRGRTGEK